MPSIQLPVLLLCLTLSGVCLNGRQSPPEVSEKMGRSSLDDILQRSGSHMFQFVIKKVEKKEDMNKELNVPLPQWLSKRQHPGKRYISDLEKRQHPGKRDAEEEASFGDIQKRQNLGKTEVEGYPANYLELTKRQHPGRRSLWDQSTDISSSLTYLNELSKRQHPGRRHLMYKHQLPSKRGRNDELDLGDQNWEKHQRFGKRDRDSDSSDYAGPCDLQQSAICNKGSLLLDLAEKFSKESLEEKRQHPGRRSAREKETEE
ncbi:thyrotropin releasing hormone [Phasianus colchicus]|uniref:Pro-thyrotropin-releasing hormone n=1 Tax=Phasianus colchicus TaxID=9054 RepID=A0A669PHD9_PHACC|nr:thyrotropin releasing hormone [Phasianus colchicus]